MGKALRLYQVDAFTTKRFSGNSAAVCIQEDSISDDVMQQIASEMNLTMTAFVRRFPSAAEGEYSLRWFTPEMEFPLCGHATVATAAALLEGEDVRCSELRFQTAHCGVLTVTRSDGLYHLSLPLLPPGTPSANVAQPCNAISKVIMSSMPRANCLYVGHNLKTKKVFIAIEGLTRKMFESWDPPIAQLKGIPSSGDILSVIVSCAGGGQGEPELLLRFFAPWEGIDEDPVTGSAFAVAGPWWASRLQKASFAARQCSKRGGDLHITVSEAEGRVDVSGGAVIVSEGRLFLD